MLLSFIVHFPIGLDFLFISFCHGHLLCRSQILLYPILHWSSNWSSALNSKLHRFIHPVLITCTYHLSLPLLMIVVTGSTPTILLNSSFVLLSFREIPHIHLTICYSLFGQQCDIILWGGGAFHKEIISSVLQ